MEINYQIFSIKSIKFSFPQNLWKMWISSIRLKCSGILFSMEFIKKIHKIEGIQYSTEFVKNVNFMYSMEFVEFLFLSWKLWFHCRFRWIGNGRHISTFSTNLKNLIPQFSTEIVKNVNFMYSMEFVENIFPYRWIFHILDFVEKIFQWNSKIRWIDSKVLQNW